MEARSTARREKCEMNFRNNLTAFSWKVFVVHMTEAPKSYINAIDGDHCANARQLGSRNWRRVLFGCWLLFHAFMLFLSCCCGLLGQLFVLS